MKKFRYTFYDIFRTKARNSKDASLNEIMKNTKSLLASRREYESYIHNYFSSIEDIKKVSGIGDGIFNQINSLIKI